MLKELTKPLTKDDIEIRVGNCTAKGFSLLLYKTARTDMKRLNEVCGVKWSNKHYVDNKSNVVCSIGIKEDNEWIWREDTGSESFTEKEKGSYSDSFKRAGFRWGIGIELYDAPFIWIDWEMVEFKGRFKPKGFYTSKVKVAGYKVEDNEVVVALKHGNQVIFNNSKKAKEAY